METRYRITRRIGIDAGHRLQHHGSKCRHLHGHRYEIEATCVPTANALQAGGEESGMVMDFGFLKDEMLLHIDAACDHGLILNIADIPALTLFCPAGTNFDVWHEQLRKHIEADGFALNSDNQLSTKLYLIDADPTAECLARHWFNRLQEPVARRSDGQARLARVKVWETPNCYAEYAGSPL